MKTSERRAKADHALSEIDKLELEIRAKMAQHDIKGELDANYADFKAYTVLRDLHQQYLSWKQEFVIYADHADLVAFVGQSEHDILRENYPKITADTEIVTIPTTETTYFHTQDNGTGQVDKVKYTVKFEKIRILPFYSCYVEAINSLFIRVNLEGVPG